MTKLNASILGTILAALGLVGGYFAGEEIECAPIEVVAPETPE